MKYLILLLLLAPSLAPSQNHSLEKEGSNFLLKTLPSENVVFSSPSLDFRYLLKYKQSDTLVYFFDNDFNNHIGSRTGYNVSDVLNTQTDAIFTTTSLVSFINNNSGDISLQAVTGWGDYVDTQYTSGTPFSITPADGLVSLPNNAVSVVDFQKPTDIPAFYDSDSQTITGRNGDAISITIEFKVRPTSPASDVRVTVSIDIGGAVGEIYKRDFALTKGNGSEHFYLSAFSAYTLGTWEANGGTVKV